MKKLFIMMTIVLVVLSLSLTASAQKVKTKTYMDFTEVTFEAGVKKPKIVDVGERAEKKFKPMIPMRVSFENELFKSTDALK